MIDDPQSETPEQRLARIQAQGETPEDRLARIQAANVDPNAALHREYASGQLAKRMGAANEADQAAVPSMLETASQVPETVAAGVPGAKLLISKARSMLQGRPMADVQQEVNQETSDVPYGSAIGRAAGGMATMPFLPSGGAVSGAIYGGADQALNNDPNESVTQRALRTVGGAAVGGLVGGAADRLITGGRALLSKGGEAAKDAALGARSDVADPLYAAVRNSGTSPVTPEMNAMLQHPDIEPIVAKLQTLEQYAGKGPNDPELLMAVRKNLSDWGHQLDKQGAVMDPSKANLIGDLKQHIALLKDKFDQAAETQVPGFGKAVQTFADESLPVNAQEAGYEAARRKLSGGLASWKNIGKKTPAALDTYLAAHPGSGVGAGQGILAATRDATNLTPNPLKGFGLPGALTVAGKTAPLLHAADNAAGRTAPTALQKALGRPVPNALQKALLMLAAQEAPR